MVMVVVEIKRRIRRTLNTCYIAELHSNSHGSIWKERDCETVKREKLNMLASFRFVRNCPAVIGHSLWQQISIYLPVKGSNWASQKAKALGPSPNVPDSWDFTNILEECSWGGACSVGKVLSEQARVPPWFWNPRTNVKARHDKRPCLKRRATEEDTWCQPLGPPIRINGWVQVCRAHTQNVPESLTTVSK